MNIYAKISIRKITMLVWLFKSINIGLNSTFRIQPHTKKISIYSLHNIMCSSTYAISHHIKNEFTPTQLYSISDIQRVSYCRGYLSGTAQASDTSVTISYLQDLSYLKSIDFKPQKDNQEQPLYIYKV